MIYLLIIHILISLILGVFLNFKSHYLTKIVRVNICFFYPIGGCIIITFLHFAMNRKQKKIEEEEFIAKKLFTDRVDFEKEVNIVSIDYSLNSEDINVKRKQILNVLKMDTSQYLDKLKKALKDDDVETSHYAAVAIAKNKRELDLNYQKLFKIFSENSEDKEIHREYLSFMKIYTNTDVHIPIVKRKYRIEYIKSLKSYIEKWKGEDYIYRELIDNLFITGSIEEAKLVITKYIEEIGDEESLLYHMKYYYITRDQDGFDKAKSALLNSNLEFSNNTLKIVRFWIGASNGRKK